MLYFSVVHICPIDRSAHSALIFCATLFMLQYNIETMRNGCGDGGVELKSWQQHNLYLLKTIVPTFCTYAVIYNNAAHIHTFL